MELSELTIRIVLLLIPGLVAAIIIENLTIHKKWESWKFILYAILLGIFSYAILQLGSYIIQAFSQLGDCSKCQIQFTTLISWKCLFNNRLEIPVSEVVFAFMISIILGLLITYLIQKKILFKVGQKLGISNKFGDENIYHYLLNTDNVNWVYVRDQKNNLSYRGQVEIWSESQDSKIRELVLKNTSVYRYEDSEHLYDVQRIFLVFKFDEALRIELIQD